MDHLDRTDRPGATAGAPSSDPPPPVRVFLLCGPAGSGKSTRARALEAKGWARLSLDVAAWREGYRDHPLPDDVTVRLKARLRQECVELVRAGRDVVVDLSFWSRAMRDDYRALLRPLGVVPVTIYLPTPREVVLARLARRAGTGPDDVVVTPETASRYLDGFEPPTPDEGPLEVLEHHHGAAPARPPEWRDHAGDHRIDE
ncbi:AAA family ATPase [Isoptericola aurantiacus]|uniref:AAA family ATPase n=1 Tax=Isoptericola aurantiacus TaxID=3377839 RepID=UPI00383BDFF0